MEITNKLNLPEVYVKAVSTGQRVPQVGRLSATELIAPPQMRALQTRYWNKLSDDASDRLWALLGTSIHYVLEQLDHGDVQEQRFTVDYREHEISGQMDMIDGGTIVDFKVTSVYSFLLGVKPEWERQLNIYAWLARKFGVEVKKLEIYAILRDWIASKQTGASDYPECPFKAIEVPLWNPNKINAYIDKRIELHAMNAILKDEELTACNSEERWQRPTVYAVKKKGRKRALKLFGSKKEAEKYTKDQKGLFIETRPGSNVRCEGYCTVKTFCHQYNSPMGEIING